MKSAYEIALERLEAQGIEKPSSDALTDEVRADVAEIRSKAKAELAKLEILYRDRLAKERDPTVSHQDEQNYLSDRARIERRCDRDVAKLRNA